MSLLILFYGAPAAPPAEITGSGNATLPFGAGGAGVAAVQGNGGAALSISAGGSGTVAVVGAGNAGLSLSSAGRGIRRFAGFDPMTRTFDQMGGKLHRGRMLIEMRDAGVLFEGRVLDPTNGPHEVPRGFGIELVMTNRAREVIE